MSSKRRMRRNQCGNKVRHASAEAARVAIQVMLKRTGGAVGFLQSYRCPFCSGWHIGHARKVRW